MLKWIIPLLLVASAPAVAQDGHGQQAGGDGKAMPYARYTQQMQAAMDRMMRDMHGTAHAENPDIAFLAMMIPHHEAAVEMARLVLIHGRDPATRRLAEDIIASQAVEIEGMKRRLAMLRAKKEAGEFPALGGTRGPAP